MTARGSGTGTAQVGIWRAGVDVEPGSDEGFFAIGATADYDSFGFRPGFGIFFPVATADLTFAGQVYSTFDIDGAADLLFVGTSIQRESFAIEAVAVSSFNGFFVAEPLVGSFALEAIADLEMIWVPFQIGPGTANVKDDPSKVIVKDEPSDVIAKDDPSEVINPDAPTDAIQPDDPTEVIVKDGTSEANINKTKDS